MSPPLERPTALDCSDCPVSIQVLKELGKLAEKVDDLRGEVGGIRTDLEVHTALHKERERLQAQQMGRGVQWPKIAEAVLTWGTIALITLLLVLILLHSKSALSFFGVG